MSFRGWKPYVPVHKRRANAERRMKQLAKQGRVITPVAISGRTIAHTFWGKAWCDHLEKFSDYANRLPRGRTYVRNGSVCHLEIGEGRIEAIVSGSELYDIAISIQPLPAGKWQQLREQCTGKIGSMLELLQGKFSSHVMERVTHRDHGLFPGPGEIKMKCSCPDWAGLCKHLAAVLYGVGARLDAQPELLFKLRGVDHQELIAAADFDLPATAPGSGRRRLAGDQLGGIFGVEIGSAPEPVVRRPAADDRAAEPVGRAALAKGRSVKKAEPVAERAAVARGRSVKKAEPVVERAAVAKGRSVKKAERVAERPAAAKRAAATAQQVDTIRPTATAKRQRATASATPVAKPKPFIPTAEAVTALRQRLGLNKSEFARLIGVSQPTIGNWEKRTGLLAPAPDVLARLRELAG